MSDAEPRNPRLETKECLEARMVELDLLEQALNQRRDLYKFKLQRLADLQERLGRVQPANSVDGELLDQVTEKLDEWSLLPGITHVEDCGYWGTDDGDGPEYCDCEYKREVDAWARCRQELAELFDAHLQAAELKTEIKIHDEYWHSQKLVAEHDIGPVALANKEAAELALRQLNQPGKEK